MSITLARLAGIRVFRPVATVCQVRCEVGEAGSGIGKGGGTGGSIRDAGGSFGKMEAAHEEQYFRRLERDWFHKQDEQIKALKRHHDDEIEAHEREIRRHQEEVERLKKRVKEIDVMKDDSSDSN